MRPASVGGAASALVVVIVLAACTGASASPSGGTPPPASAAPSAAPPSGSAPTVPSEILDSLTADAAERTGTPREAIVVTEAQATTWTTGALGCPAPGVDYTQQLVNGWRVVLDAAGTRLDYRVSAPGRFKLCAGPGG